MLPLLLMLWTLGAVHKMVWVDFSKPRDRLGSLMILTSLGFIRSESGFYKFEVESGYLKNERTELNACPYKSNLWAFSSFRLGYGGMGEGAAVVWEKLWRLVASDRHWAATTTTATGDSGRRVMTTIFLWFIFFCKNRNLSLLSYGFHYFSVYLFIILHLLSCHLTSYSL